MKRMCHLFTSQESECKLFFFSFGHFLIIWVPWHPVVHIGVFREATTDFTVDARPLSKSGGDHIKAQVTNPSGTLTDCIMTDKGDGTYNVEYTPFENGTKNKSVYQSNCIFTAILCFVG